MTTQISQPAEHALASFAYHGQTPNGEAIAGTIEALDVEQARQKLQTLQLHVMEIAPAEKPARGRALSAEDFLAFNQQLAHLTAAGLPMEHGLRLIADDMRRGRLASTIRLIAAELESGRSLPEAFDKHRGQFPSLYGRLLDAGIRSANLPGILFSLSRHLEMVRRLRSALWRAAAYPFMVSIALVLVLMFISTMVVPKFDQIFRDFKVALPAVTNVLLGSSQVLPPLLLAALGLILFSPVILWLIRRVGLDGALRDRLVCPLPLIGPVVKKSILAGWCDAARIAIESGMDLPAAIELASNTCGSPRLERDGRTLINWISAGRPFENAPYGAMLPATVIAAMALAAQTRDLPNTLRSLSDMYQQQADVRLQSLPAILTPLLVLLIAAVIGFVVVALLAPMLALIGAVSGSKF